jgi:Zn-dependent protease with chaperone function
MGYSRLNVAFVPPEGLLASNSYLVAVIGASLLPLVCSLIFCLLALRSEEPEQAANWPVHLRRIRTLNLLAVPAWWAVSGVLIESGAKLNSILDWTEWIPLVLPLSVGMISARLLTGWTGSRIEGRHWTFADLFRLSLWSSLTSTVPLLFFAAGIDALRDWSPLGILWIGGAGLLANLAKGRLRSAEGLKPRLVKSGELFKRSIALARQMGVHLIGVFVYPTGRGRLTNAHGGAGFIGMTDICIHWLHGAQLDFVIGHELAHVKQKHGEKERRIGAGSYLGVAALGFAAQHLPLVWQVFFKFGAIIVPLLVFYFISRQYELEADRIALELTVDGEAAIRALANLYMHSGVPANCNAFDELFLTHPGLWKRINAIARAGRIPVGSVARLRQEIGERA